MSTAVFGGSFDPPHVAHVMLAAYVLSVVDVDRLLVVPSWQHPLDKATRSSFEHRHRMCELAFRILERTEVSRIEADLGGRSYTLRTLEELARREPGEPLRLVIGADILGEVEHWHRFDRVTDLAPPIVVGRSGYEAPDTWDVLPVELPPVSSTDIRARLGRGESAQGLVPSAVLAYAEQQGLYGDAP